jgi:hypothetical protein
MEKDWDGKIEGSEGWEGDVDIMDLSFKLSGKV